MRGEALKNDSHHSPQQLHRRGGSARVPITFLRPVEVAEPEVASVGDTQASSHVDEGGHRGQPGHDLTNRAIACDASRSLASFSSPPALTALTTQCARCSSSRCSATPCNARVAAEDKSHQLTFLQGDWRTTSPLIINIVTRTAIAASGNPI